MNPTVLIDEARTPDGFLLKLTTRADYFEVSIEGVTLMASTEHHSEVQMADIVCQELAADDAPRVLVGGLGMGFTLRAALDRLSPNATVVVVELMEAVVRWNRGPLAHLAYEPLSDSRTVCENVDLVDYLEDNKDPFDGILLDVDNGPEPFTVDGNSRLYDERGLERLMHALKPGGVAVVWSAFSSPAFAVAMEKAGFETQTVRTRSRGHRGGHHTLFVGRKPDLA